MKTVWVMIVLLNFVGNPASTSIGYFLTKPECQKAGKEVAQTMKNPVARITYLCVEVHQP